MNINVWCTKHNASIAVSPVGDMFHVTIGLRRLRSYGDETGMICDEFEISRQRGSVIEAIVDTIAAADVFKPEWAGK